MYNWRSYQGNIWYPWVIIFAKNSRFSTVLLFCMTSWFLYPSPLPDCSTTSSFWRSLPVSFVASPLADGGLFSRSVHKFYGCFFPEQHSWALNCRHGPVENVPIIFWLGSIDFNSFNTFLLESFFTTYTMQIKIKLILACTWGFGFWLQLFSLPPQNFQSNGRVLNSLALANASFVVLFSHMNQSLEAVGYILHFGSSFLLFIPKGCVFSPCMGIRT